MILDLDAFLAISSILVIRASCLMELNFPNIVAFETTISFTCMLQTIVCAFISLDAMALIPVSCDDIVVLVG